MSDYIYTSDGELYHADELYHYGVPGMKWRKRKARPLSDVQKARRADKKWSDVQSQYRSLGKTRVTRALKATYGKSDAVKKYRREYDNWEKSAKSAKKAATKAAVKDYNKSFDLANKLADKADKKWSDVQSQYRSLGKTRVTRALKATYGKSDAVKKYRREYDNWEKSQNEVDKQWKDARKKYKKTGKTGASRVVNNIRYGK